LKILLKAYRLKEIFAVNDVWKRISSYSLVKTQHNRGLI